MYKTYTRETKHCEKCKITGKLRVGNLHELHNCDIIACPYCFGDGFYILETTTERFRKSEILLEPLIPRS